MWTATSDGIIRASRSPSNRFEMEQWTKMYFAQNAHESLLSFVQFVHTPYQNSDPPPTGKWGDALGFKVVVMTHSSIHTNISLFTAFPQHKTLVYTLPIYY